MDEHGFLPELNHSSALIGVDKRFQFSVCVPACCENGSGPSISVFVRFRAFAFSVSFCRNHCAFCHVERAAAGTAALRLRYGISVIRGWFRPWLPPLPSVEERLAGAHVPYRYHLRPLSSRSGQIGGCGAARKRDNVADHLTPWQLRRIHRIKRPPQRCQRGANWPPVPGADHASASSSS